MSSTVDDRARTVAVIGGGIAGMVAALDLARAGLDVELLEQDQRLGGKLLATEVGGVRVDVGPDGFVARRPEAVDLCKELGVAHELVAPGVSGAALWARGRLRRLPTGLVLGVPTSIGSLARSGIVGPAGTLRAVADWWRAPPALTERSATSHSLHDTSAPGAPAMATRTTSSAANDRSVSELVEPRLGHRVTSRLVDPLVGGIHAGSVQDLSAEAVFPALLAASQRGGSLMRNLASVAGSPPPRTGTSPVFATLRFGLAGLISHVQGALVGSGVTIHLGAAVLQVAPILEDSAPRWRVTTGEGTITVDGVVLAVPTPAASRLLDPGGHDHLQRDAPGVGGGADGGLGEGAWKAVQRRLARALGAIDYATVHVVTFAFDPDGAARRWRRAPGTGFLVPTEQGLLTTAGTWLSAKWPAVYPDGPVLVRLSAGRHGDDRASQLDDDDLVSRLLGELRAVAGDVDDPLDAVVTRWVDAFPQYRVGHRSWAAATASLADALPTVALAGAAYDGVGVPACIGSGRRAAQRLLEQLRADRPHGARVPEPEPHGARVPEPEPHGARVQGDRLLERGTSGGSPLLPRGQSLPARSAGPEQPGSQMVMRRP